MTTKEFIKCKLVELHSEANTNIYGSIDRSRFTLHLFGHRKQEVKEYCKNDKVLQFSKYCGSFGTYDAFTIKDNEIRVACMEALKKNPNYLRNVNSW